MKFSELKNRLVKLRGSTPLNVGKIMREVDEVELISERTKRYRVRKFLVVKQFETGVKIKIPKRFVIKRKGKLRERGGV